MRPNHLRYFIKILAVGIDTVMKYNVYVPSTEQNLNGTAWKVCKKVCDNCHRLLGWLKKKSGFGCLNYYDWWYALKGVCT
jgi:protein-arginine kinase activator protein McsA